LIIASRTTEYNSSRRSNRSLLRLAALPGGVLWARSLPLPEELNGTVASTCPKPELSAGTECRADGVFENQFKKDIKFAFGFGNRRSVFQLFANTKLGEDDAQQIVGGELSCDLTQGVLP
jgi:hypothetical protein